MAAVNLYRDVELGRVEETQVTLGVVECVVAAGELLVRRQGRGIAEGRIAVTAAGNFLPRRARLLGPADLHAGAVAWLSMLVRPCPAWE